MKVFCVLFTGIMCVHVLDAQNYQTRDKIALAVSSNLTLANQVYRYNYVLTNGLAAQESVYVFDLRLPEGIFISDLQAPGTWRGRFFAETPKVVRWHATVSRQSHHFRDLVVPGASKSGFSFNSRFLPGILTFYAEGWAPAPVFDEGEATDSIPGYSDITPYGPGVVGMSIGPVDSLLPFVPGEFLDTLDSYINQSLPLHWIKDTGTADKYLGYLSSTKSSLQQGNITVVRATLRQLLSDVNIDSASKVTSEAYALIRYNTEYLLSQLPPAPPPGLAARLVNSIGTLLTGGSLQYYEGSWKDAINNGDGTFSVNTTLSIVSLRMTYAYGFQQKNNVPVNGGPVVFQTVNTQVKLQNSQATLIDTGVVQYYAGAWRTFGTTSNGVASMELLPATYSFRMTYAGGSNDKQQDIGTNATVVFQTVNATVQLHNSQGALIDQGTVQYYAGSWRNFGTTLNGSATQELLSNSYTFRMTNEYVSNDKTQNIGTNSIVSYSTVLCTVRVTNTLGQSVDGAQISYYSGAWRTIGQTANGQITKELLPANLSFRMSYGGKTLDKQQNLVINPLIEFVTQ